MKNEYRDEDALEEKHLDGGLTALWPPTDALDVSLMFVLTAQT